MDNKYHALVEFASYLLKDGTKNTLADYPVPVLTIGGEMDGLTRMSRIAHEFANFNLIKQSKGEEVAVSTKPVVVLEGINHSDFCTDFNVTDDIQPAEVGPAAAQKRIAEVSSAFLNLVVTGKDSASYGVLKTAVDRTAAFFAPWFALEKVPVCALAQQQSVKLADEDAKRVSVSVNTAKDSASFQQAHPTITPVKGSGGSSSVATVAFATIAPNDNDRSTVPQAPRYVSCKLFNELAVAQSLGIKSIPRNATCAELNQANFDLAVQTYQQSWPQTVQRYRARGKQLVFGPDQIVSNEKAFYSASVAYTAKDKSTWQVVSPSLWQGLNAKPDYLAGARYCSVVPPLRFVEWMQTDSLKDNPAV